MRENFYGDYFDFEEWHWWFAGRRRILVTFLDHYVGPSAETEQREILDVGCGTGSTLATLGRYGTAEGLDPDPEAVRLCRERGLERVRQAHPPPLLFDDGRFDLVTAFDVLEHTDDDVALLREIARVIRPGGAALFTVPAYDFLWGPQDEISDHRRRYTTRVLRERIEAAGLSIRRLSYFNSFLFPAIAAVRMARRLVRRDRVGEPRSDFELSRPGFSNRVLTRVFGAEAPLLRWRDLPFGVSILAFTHIRHASNAGQSFHPQGGMAERQAQGQIPPSPSSPSHP